MPRLVISTAAEQVAAHLREEIRRGVWKGLMPGSERLAAELGIGGNTAEAALALLEKEGLLQTQGRRRGRLVRARKGAVASPSLRIALLLTEAADLSLNYVVEIRHALENAGHTCFAVPKTMADLANDAARIQRMARKTEADAWLVLSGPYELMEWFAKGRKPAFAIFGRRRELRIAGSGPDKRTAIVMATRQLIGLGHRRIVLMTRTRRRLPQPGHPEQGFLEELVAQGLPAGGYNLPHWEETTAGFHIRLEALFRITPPTALIIDEAPFFFATQQFLARKGLTAPEDVSLVCTDYSQDFDWCQPAISHIRWESRPLVRHILKWVSNVSQGKEDYRQTESPAEFVHGGTIGPVKG
jgi:DNA-binding LacI/PurR family transcriptional regulator